MTTALFAGSFDPITLGHLDIATRALSVADEVVVAVGVHPRKRYMFDHSRRVEMVRRVFAPVEGVRVVEMRGALVECVREVGADLVVKGVRSAADFDDEMVQAVVNRDCGGVETVFIPARPELSVVSSSVVRELLGLGFDVARYVPDAIVSDVRDNGRGH